MQGSIKFVAQFLMDNLPENEEEADSGSEDEGDEEEEGDAGEAEKVATEWNIYFQRL